MRKRIKYFASLFILLLPFSILTSCRKKPWDYENVVWSSQQPEIEITQKAGEQNYGYILVGGNKVLITLAWGLAHVFDIIVINEDGTYVDDIVSDETVLLSGGVKFDSKTATLTIRVDNVFNYEFEKIVLTWRDL